MVGCKVLGDEEVDAEILDVISRSASVPTFNGDPSLAIPSDSHSGGGSRGDDFTEAESVFTQRISGG